MPRANLQILFIVALVVIAAFYLIPGSEPDPKVSAWQKALPKTYLVNTRTSTYDEDGALTNVLQAKTATFYPSKNESVMESPRLYTHNLDDDAWSASSNIGHYEHRREMLTLTEDVVLRDDTHQVQLDTQRMRIDLRKNRATSRVPVTLTHGGSSTRADGMVAIFDAQTVRLAPNVETIYVQPSP